MSTCQIGTTYLCIVFATKDVISRLQLSVKRPPALQTWTSPWNVNVAESCTGLATSRFQWHWNAILPVLRPISVPVVIALPWSENRKYVPRLSPSLVYSNRASVISTTVWIIIIIHREKFSQNPELGIIFFLLLLLIAPIYFLSCFFNWTPVSVQFSIYFEWCPVTFFSSWIGYWLPCCSTHQTRSRRDRDKTKKDYVSNYYLYFIYVSFIRADRWFSHL